MESLSCHHSNNLKLIMCLGISTVMSPILSSGSGNRISVDCDPTCIVTVIARP